MRLRPGKRARDKAERAAWEEWAKVAREQATYTDLDEGAAWAERNPGPTFKARLVNQRSPERTTP